ncbi:hypothetical protein FBUS_00494 [Fasciolopsis buskii]|uniref:Uncharacterized protein n=1 Tax=Fasciolopsis buskii TaxID=27845 RepID=A0A8E0S3D6_9TREM|nr:hypothetical protein FBUS_00494 [Fasciolopsis buski]
MDSLKTCSISLKQLALDLLNTFIDQYPNSVASRILQIPAFHDYVIRPLIRCRRNTLTKQDRVSVSRFGLSYRSMRIRGQRNIAQPFEVSIVY